MRTRTTKRAKLRHLTSMLSMMAMFLVSVNGHEPSIITTSSIESLPIIVNVNQFREVHLSVKLNTSVLGTQGVASVRFRARTILPRFNTLQLLNGTEQKLNMSVDTHNISVNLSSSYIGRGTIEPVNITIQTPGGRQTYSDYFQGVPVIATVEEGIFGQLFSLSVCIVLLVSFVGLGVQLDMKCLTMIVRKPAAIIVGLILIGTVMPIWSWLMGQWLLQGEPLFRVGSFIFACGPPASSSTLWIALLSSDKELSVALQVLSSMISLVSIPVLFHIKFDDSDLPEGQTLRVPYLKLIQGSLLIFLGLYIGKLFVSRYRSARKICEDAFEYIALFAVVYMIVFSLFNYHFLYKLLDRDVILSSALVALGTCLVTASVGFLVNLNVGHAVTISVSSVCKNYGLTFAILYVALDVPDSYIAFVPCIVQVVLTSMAFYPIYGVTRIVQCIARRNQPIIVECPIRSPVESPAEDEREDTSRTTSEKLTASEESIAMMINDLTEEPLDYLSGAASNQSKSLVDLSETKSMTSDTIGRA